MLDRQRGRRAGDRRPDHRGVSHHRSRRTHDARASPARKRRTDAVCHRTIGRSVARTSAPGIAGDHRRAEHQRPALHRPRPIRGGPGPGGRRPGRNDAHAGSSRRVQLRQRCHGLPAQRQAVNRRHRGDRHRRLVVPAGGRPGARPGAGRPRLLVHRARGPPHPRPHLPAGRAGGVHALPRRAARVGHHGVPRPARTGGTRSGGRHRRLREPAAGRRALGRTQRHLGWSAPGHPRRPRPDRGDVARRVRGGRPRHVGTGARPGDRPACWPNTSPPASSPKPCASSTHCAEPAARPPKTGSPRRRETRPSRAPESSGAALLPRPAPDDNHLPQRKDTTQNDQHRTLFG